MEQLKKIDQKENVNKFEMAYTGLFLWLDGKIYLDDKIVFEHEINTAYFFQEVLFIVTNDWKDSVYIDFNRQTKTVLKDIGGLDVFLDQKSILFNKWNDDYTKSFKQKIDLDSGDIIWEIETYFGKPFLSDGYLFGSLESKLFRIDMNTGDFIWQYNLSEKHNCYSINGEDIPIDVQGYIGIYNGCLYIRAGIKLILGIDVSSGKESFCYEYNGENVLLDNLRLDGNKGVIFSIGSMEYFELNLSFYISEIMPVKGNDNIKTIKLGSWKDNIVYFWEGGTNSNFGLFDRDKKEIKIVHNLNTSGYPAIKDIKHGHGKVYVLDGNNSLHLFEQFDYPA